MDDSLKIRVSAELDKNAGKQIQDGLNKVTPKPIEVPFKIDFKNSKEIENEMKRLVSKLTKGKGSLSDFKIDTSTIFDDDLGKRIEKLNGVTIKYKNELGEVISELYKFNQIGSNIDSSGQEEIIMGWSKAMSSYSQNTEKATNNLMRQKELVEQMKLLQIQADKSGTTLNQDNLTGFDTANKNNNIKEMTHYLKLAKTEYSQLNALMEKDLPISGLENMKKNIGTMPIDIQNVETSFKKLQVQPEELRTRIDQLGNSFKSLESFKGAEADKVKQYNLLKGEITGVTKEVKSLIAVQQQQVSLDDKTKFSSSITSWSNDNTKGAKLFRVELERIQRELIGADKTKFTSLKKEFQSIQAETKAMGKSGRTVLQELGNNFKKFASWYGIAGIVTSAVRGVKQMVSTVVELDQSLVDLQQATGFTAEETGKLLNTYIDLGQELGATGTEVAQSADVWLRQGKSLSETNTLIRDSMILSKIGQVDSAKSTQYLTSAMKGYKLEASEVLSVIDRMASVDLSSATSIGGLAEAMSRTATGANMAGIEMDKLLGMLAVVGEVTQKSMDSIGESFKTIFARMGNVKLGKLVDEDGNDITTEINDVEKILNKVDIKLRDSATSFRNFGDVLDDVGGSWSDFNEVEQNAIANAFAGVRQRENFNVLMENYGDSLKYAEISANSAGTAMEKFSAYEESVEAKTKRLQASLQELAVGTLDSSVVKGFLDLANGVVNATDKIGLLNIAIIALMTALNVKKGTVVLGWLSKLTGALGLATGASTTLGLALSAIIPTALILGGLTLITKGLDAVIITLEEQKEALEAANTAYEESKTELKNINSELDTTRKRIDELNAKENLTFVEKGELEELKDITAELLIQKDIQEKINESNAKTLATTASDTFKKQFSGSNISENQIGEYVNDSNVTGNNAILVSDANNISSMIAGYRQFIKLQDEALGSGATEDYEHFKGLTEGISQSLWDSVSALQAQQSDMKDYYNIIKDTPYDKLTSEQKEIYDNYNLISDAIELIYTNIDPAKWKELQFTEVFNSSEMKTVKKELEELAKAGELTPEVLTSNKEYQKLLDETGLEAEEVAEHINGLSETVESSGEQVEQAEITIISLSDALSKMSNSGKTLQSLNDEFEELNYISTDTLNSLIDKYPQLEQAVANYVAGKITEKDLIAEMSKVYQTDYENYREFIIKKQELDEGFYKDVVGNLPLWVKDLAESYGIDFNNFKNLQSSKLKIAAEYEKKLAEIQRLDNLYKFQTAIDPLGIKKDAFGGMYSNTKSKLEQEAKDYQKILDGIDLSLNTTLDIDGYTPSGLPKDKTKSAKDKTKSAKDKTKSAKDKTKSAKDKTKSSSNDPIKDAFDFGIKDKKGNIKVTGKNDLDHKLAMEEITQKKYLKGLEKINEATFGQAQDTHLEQYRQYLEEVHKGRKSLEFSETIDWASMSLQRLQDDVDIAQNKLDNTEGYQAQIDAINELIEAQEALKAGYQSSATLYKSQYDNVKGIDKYKTMIETGATFELVDITDKKLRESISNAVDYFNKWRDSLNKIDSTTKSISKNYQEINNVLDSTISDIENIQGRLANSIKKENQEQYDNRLKHLRKMRDLDVKYHNDKIALLEEEIKRIQGNTIPDKLGKLSKLQGNYQEWLSDDSTLGKAKQKELLDQITEMDKEIQIDRLEEKIKSERDIIEDINDKFDKAIDEESENFDAWLKTYKDRMSDQKAYEKANALMLSGNQKEIERLIKTYDPVYSGIATMMGQTAGDIIAKAVSEALSGLGLLKGNGGGSSGGGSSSGGSNNNTPIMDKNGDPIYENLDDNVLSKLKSGNHGSSSEGLSNLNQYVVGQGYDVLTKKEMVDIAKNLGVKGIDSVADVGTDSDGRWNKNQILDALIDKGYITQYAIGGETKNDGMAYLHKNERVLTSEQTNAFNKLVYDYIPNIFGNMTKGSMIDKSAITNRNVTFNKELVSYNVDKIVNYTPFDAKNEQDNLNRMFTKSLQKSGINTKL